MSAVAVDPEPSGIFVSYCHRNKAAALRLEQALTACNLSVRIDREAMRPGQAIREFIHDSIRFTHTTLWIVSEESLLSDWVGIEIATTLSDATLWKQRRLIACYLDDTFLRDDFQLYATDTIDKRLIELGQLIAEHDRRAIGTDNLHSKKSRLRDLRHHLDALLERLRTTLCIDLRDSHFNEGLEQLLTELAPKFAGGRLWRASSSDIEQRCDEIYSLVTSGDGERTFKRLMDFVRDFSRKAEHKERIALISWRFRAAETARDHRVSTELLESAFGLLKQVIEEQSGG